MKNKLLPLLFVLGAYGAYGQVGVGTPLPNSSSQLDVVASDKGILIPRLALTSSTDTTTITNGNINSLLVFNTAVVADITAGYYYWYQNRWNRLASTIDLPSNVVVWNPVTNQFTYIDAAGNTQVIDITQIIQDNETLTSAAFDAATGILTYNDEDGVATAMNLGSMIANFETLTSISQDAAAGTITYVDENGAATVLDIAALIAQNETLTSAAFDAATGILTYNDEDGVATAMNLGTMIANFETLTSISQDAAAGTITYVDENGTATVLDIAALIAQNETLTSAAFDAATGILTYNDEDGVATAMNLGSMIANFETLTSISQDAAAGTLTYVDEDGTATVLDIAALIAQNETNTTLAFDPATSALTYTNEDGDNPVVDLSALKVEPWKIQTTANDATANTEDIYQQGKVGVGFVAGDALSTKQFEVKGDLKAMTTNAGGKIVGMETNTAASGSNNIVFGDNENPDAMVTGSYFKQRDYENVLAIVTDAATANENSSKVTQFSSSTAIETKSTDTTGKILVASSNISMGVDNFATNNTTITQSDGNSITQEAYNASGDLTRFTSTKDAFNFQQVIANAPVANYNLPKTNGTVGQVLITDGALPNNATPAQLTWADASTLAPEPWKIQTTANDATANTEDIYQQGKVGVGFVAGDALSTKQLEVKGDFKSLFTSGTYSSGIENNLTVLGVPVNASYIANDVDPSIATELSAVVLRPGIANLQAKNGGATGTLAGFADANGGTFSLLASNATSDVSAAISGNSNTTLSNLTLSHQKNAAESTNVTVDKLRGVTYDFKTTGSAVEGNYTFPRNNGLPNQVLTTDGTANAQLVWKDAVAANAIRTESAAYLALATDETILVNASAGPVTITLPAGASIGKKFNIKKIDSTSNTVLVNGNGSLIDNLASVQGSLPYQGWVVQYDGTAWFIISRI